MTKRTENGTGARRIALDLQDAHLLIAMQVKLAVADLTDGDNDTSQAVSALNEIGWINYRMNDVQVSIADRALMDAEIGAQNLVANGGK